MEDPLPFGCVDLKVTEKSCGKSGNLEMNQVELLGLILFCCLFLKVFSGNTDQNSMNRTEFDPYINARLLRVQGKTWMGSIALRTEFFGFEGTTFYW